MVPMRLTADLQQSWPVQSLLCVQVLGQVEAQRPLQHSSPEEESQSAEELQALGQVSYLGFRHSPDVLRLPSILPTDVQQISPDAVSQSVLEAHALGQREGGRQIGWL